MHDDILRGAKAISAFRGEPLRRTYYLLENGLIPAAKVGEIWEARKSRLTEHQHILEDATLARRDAPSA